MDEYINCPIAWYAVFFALGFSLSFFLSLKIIKNYLYSDSLSLEENQKNIIYSIDSAIPLVIFFSIIGARMGYIFFYGWPTFKAHPESIFNLREGGLASHGGAIGALIALFILSKLLKKRFSKLTFLTILDAVVVPTALAGACIRIGNFFNQEITGTPTSLPWGVHFLHPMNGFGGVVHPVQLYEALFYFAFFACMLMLWKKRGKELGSGFLSGIFFILFFTFRFFIEFLKIPQGEVLPETSWIKMGQLLSLPFIFLGVYLVTRYFRKRETVSAC